MKRESMKGRYEEYDAMKNYGEVELWLHVFLTSTLEGGE
jgi:hypothetical protein